MIFQFKSRALFAFGAAVCALAFAGCGGGSSSGPTTTTPTATAIPTTNVSVTVQLRDPAGAPVNGLVTIGAQRRATTNGDAAFTNVPGGAQTVAAEVNGVNTTKNFVATSGANVVQISIDPNTPAPGGTTPPAPPF